jgi:hypothetical protein
MVEPISGIVLNAADAEYVLSAFGALLKDRRPSARLADFIGRLRRAVKTGDSRPDSDVSTGESARKLGVQPDSAHTAPYDLLDTGQAAAILDISGNGVRDLIRRQVLPAHRAGGRWLLPAAPVVARAEHQAARRGR